MDKDKIIDLVKQIQKKQMSPEDKEKWPKQAAMYLYRPETTYQCKQCIFYSNKKCKLFDQTEDVSPNGGCNFYIHGEPENSNIPITNLVTKIEAGYVENLQGFTCVRCEYFNMDNSCKKVRSDIDGDTPGIISPAGCCNRWSKDKIRGEMKKSELDKIIK